MLTRGLLARPGRAGPAAGLLVEVNLDVMDQRLEPVSEHPATIRGMPPPPHAQRAVFIAVPQALGNLG